MTTANFSLDEFWSQQPKKRCFACGIEKIKAIFFTQSSSYCRDCVKEKGKKRKKLPNYPHAFTNLFYGSKKASG